MKRAKNLDYAARCNLVDLLSAVEASPQARERRDNIGRVGVSDIVHTARGDNYLDFEHLELGVQKATTPERILLGHILPRNAVSERTWNTILLLLASRPVRRPLGH